MGALKETAPAKVNLTLKVLGRRPDGFHEIVSLAAFARFGDRLVLAPGEALALGTSGAFADGLSEDNLVMQAARLLEQRCPGIRTGRFELEKRLPVAAGLGGGSADAAAALRLLRRANEAEVAFEDLHTVAEQVGSDVPVCLNSQAAMMRGRGEETAPVSSLPKLSAVLVNPGVALGAGEVYAALGAGPLPEGSFALAGMDACPDTVEGVVELVGSLGNDLAGPAEKLAPVIGEVRNALDETDGCLVAEMSGSGTTCFGLYPSPEGAEASARTLSERHPDWWIVATELS